MSLAPLPPTDPTSSRLPVLADLPSLNGLPTQGPADHLGEAPARKFPLTLVLLGGAAALVVAGGLLFFMTRGSKTDRPDLLLHTVKTENLDLTVVERGTLESADNRDIICKVKAGAKGSYASTIKWVIDDGTLVKKGQLIMVLDSSALEDQFRAQNIAVDKAAAEYVAKDSAYRIVQSTNESAVEKAKSDIALAELDLEKYVGLPKATLSARRKMVGDKMDATAARALLEEIEAGLVGFLKKHGKEFPDPQGEFHKSLNDWTGQIELAVADVQMWEDRLKYSKQMEQKGYLTAQQVKADQSRLNGAMETLKKAQTEKELLQTFMAQRTVKDFSAKVQEGWRVYDRSVNEAKANDAKAKAEFKTAASVLAQEEEKLKEIEDQLEECRIHAPQDGMVVYYIPENMRWSQSERGLIQQGATVQEGQKMMRIPDLSRMQVSTRVHEAMVSRVKGDDRRSTGLHESVRTALLLNPSPINALMSQEPDILERQRLDYAEYEYYDAARGMPASIRVDAFADRPLRGHVRTVATVASATDWSSADVKVYATIVAIDDTPPGLKPGMSAEVTIHVDKTLENVLAIPVQAVVGGAESGRTRKVWVMTAGGPEEREVQLGLSNEKMAEVKSGLQAGDQVVVNPKAIVGNTAKTREDMADPAAKGGAGGKGKGGAGGKMKGKGGPPAEGGTPGEGGGAAPGGGGGGSGKGPPAKQ